MLVIVLLTGLMSFAQQSILPSFWKFKMEDKTEYSQISFNDAGWDSVAVPMSWDKLGVNRERTIAWYRVKFNLPKNMLGKDMILYVGTIDDADETYINGELVGRTGKFPPGDQTAWDVERKYLIPAKLLRSVNTIAIRVYNGIGGGGIYGGMVSMISKETYDKKVALQKQSKRSYYQLTTSNGLIAAVYNADKNLVEAVYPHIFSAYDSGVFVEPYLLNMQLSVKEKPLSVSYFNNTHVIEVKYRNFSAYYFAPFTTSEKIFYVLLKGPDAVVKSIALNMEKGKGSLLKREVARTNNGITDRYMLYSFIDSLHDNTVRINAAAGRLKNASASLLAEEVKYMQTVINKCNQPADLSKAERNLAEQSISILKMSQVSDAEIFPLSHGQILASLRPGVWAISWVRDASFAISAMAKLGMYDEARRGLAFMLKASPTNQYKHYVFTDGKDYGIKADYQISVTRYFGNGREESDYSTEGGPNIEIDDFGLFLIAFSDYIKESGDISFFSQWRTVIETKVADAIIQNIDERNIIRDDSGPWEHHLPGKPFTFTSGVCSRGLERFAELLKQYGHPSERYFAASRKIYDGVMTNMLVDGKFLKGNAKEQLSTDHHFYDGGTFELFADGFIKSKELFLSHMKTYDQQLQAGNDSNRGYIRFNSSDSYENQEWPFASLRVAIAQCKFGDRKLAKKQIDRITLFAGRNYNQVPEMLSIEEELYKGAIPMVGYGSAAWVLAMLEYYKQ